MEAGFWFDKVHPLGKDGRRHEDSGGLALCLEYMKANQMRRFRLEANLSALLDAYNNAMKRKIVEKGWEG